MTGTLRPNRTMHPTSKQPPMRYIRYMTDMPEASAKLVDLGTQPVVLNVRTSSRIECVAIGILARLADPAGSCYNRDSKIDLAVQAPFIPTTALPGRTRT